MLFGAGFEAECVNYMSQPEQAEHQVTNSAGLSKVATHWLPPVVLIVIALIQLLECHAGNLTPWKGGGFGMFSTSDGVDARFIKAYLIMNKGDMPVSVPSIFGREEQLVRTWPDKKQLTDLATEMTGLYWFTGHSSMGALQAKEDRALFPKLTLSANRPRATFGTNTPEQFLDEDEFVPVLGVRLEVWRMSTNSSGTVLRAEPWMSVTKMASGQLRAPQAHRVVSGTGKPLSSGSSGASSEANEGK
jgi:hypothetical protein